MQANLLPTAGRRFFRVLGFSFAQALVFGGIVGLLVFFRSPRTTLDASGESPRTFRQRWMAPLDALERLTYDWRVRELGWTLRPVESVTLVAIDDETVANAREDTHASVATRPWPRELLGRLVNLLTEEGAATTVVDLPFPDLSPRGSVPGADDEAFRLRLDRHPGSTVLTFDVGASPPPPVAPALRPFLVFLGAPPPGPAQLELLRRILGERHPAYLLPDGEQTGVWAGVTTEDEGRAFARKVEVRGTPAVREFGAADRAYQVTPVDLLVLLCEVQVPGLDPERLPQMRSVEPPAAPLLGPGTALGFRALSPDGDGVVRGVVQLVTFVSPTGKAHVLPSAELAAAMQRLGTRRLAYEEGRLLIGDRASVPMDASGYSYLLWHAAEAASQGRGSLQRSVSAWRFLRNLFDLEAGAPAHYRNELAEHAVVLTETSQGGPPSELTPLGPGVSRGAVRGQALANLLASEGFTRTPPRVDLLATFVLAFVGAFLALTFSRFFSSFLGGLAYFGSFALAFVGLLAVSRHLCLAQHQLLATAGPLLALTASFAATTFYALRTERDMHDFVRAALGRYVNPEVVRQVFRNTALMRPEKRAVTLCLADLQGFGRLFEQLSAEKLAGLLNAYLTEMTHVCREHGGQVEYMGDSVMAFFGAPVRTQRHAHLACETALAMREALKARRAEWQQKFGPVVDFDIGLSTGEVLVGDLGSAHKSNYTVMGQAVDLASRLESANRAYGTHVLAGETTQALAADDFAFREVDRVMLRGSPHRLFELLGTRSSQTTAQKEALARYEEALEFYRARRFQDALALFARAAAEDPVSSVYAERCRHFLRSPPPADWAGLGDLRSRRSA